MQPIFNQIIAGWVSTLYNISASGFKFVDTISSSTLYLFSPANQVKAASWVMGG
jgi:hypothetical protein